MMYWNGMDGWGIGLMTVAMVVFWALVAYAVVILVQQPGQTTRHSLAASTPTAAPGERPTPEQLLAERLARGEIDPDEYHTRLDALHGGGAPPASG
ncbi:SHOCT domain-containing protein [Kitasatospora sp. NPDC056531]|uniref:SHOCT domain-containing protein n=1 Tax=Kitasatospora sp. NPDC056531 TaxID=3345856 RepID=UPI0036C6C19F